MGGRYVRDDGVVRELIGLFGENGGCGPVRGERRQILELNAINGHKEISGMETSSKGRLSLESKHDDDQ